MDTDHVLENLIAVHQQLQEALTGCAGGEGSAGGQSLSQLAAVASYLCSISSDLSSLSVQLNHALGATDEQLPTAETEVQVDLACRGLNEAERRLKRAANEILKLEEGEDSPHS